MLHQVLQSCVEQFLLFFYFFGGVPKPSLLEGQTSDLMVGRSPKANNYCIVKMQNGP